MSNLAAGEPPELTLASFVFTVYEDLDVIVGMRGDLLAPQGPADSARQGLDGYTSWLGDAWPAVRATREQVLADLEAISDRDLFTVGLAGVELTAKLLLWSWARDRLAQAILEDGEEAYYAQVPNQQPPITPQQAIPSARGFRRTKWVLKWISRVLSHVDTVLGSLATILNQADRVKEIKETIEKISGAVSDDLDE